MQDLSLNILDSEWIIIAFVAIILLLGTKRLPDLSRKLGKAVGEYNRTKNTVQSEFQHATTGYNISVKGPVQTERQKLEMIAKSLGVDFLNKSDDELRNIITSKIGRQNQNQSTN